MAKRSKYHITINLTWLSRKYREYRHDFWLLNNQLLKLPLYPQVNRLLHLSYLTVSTDFHRIQQKTNHPIVNYIQIALLAVASILFFGGLFPFGYYGWGASTILILFINKTTFLRDFLPFILFVTGYSSVGFSNQVLEHHQINITNLIHWEQLLFGEIIPTVWLQSLVLSIPSEAIRHYIDLAALYIYATFFWLPFAASLVIWQYRKSWFWPYAFGFISLALSALYFYQAIPAAPPWWANYHGYLNGANTLPNPELLPVEHLLKGIMPTAAMPSFHAAYPFYISIIGSFAFGKKAWFVYLFPILISLSAIYLAHHYVVDILAGLLVALFFGLFAWFYKKQFFDHFTLTIIK